MYFSEEDCSCAQVGVESIAITVQPDGGIYVQGGVTIALWHSIHFHPVAGDSPIEKGCEAEVKHGQPNYI